MLVSAGLIDREVAGRGSPLQVVVDGINVRSNGTVEWGNDQSFNKLKLAVIRYLTDHPVRAATTVSALLRAPPSSARPTTACRRLSLRQSEGGKGISAIALRTGFSSRGTLEESGRKSSSLKFAIDCIESKQALLFLDLRERKTVKFTKEKEEGNEEEEGTEEAGKRAAAKGKSDEEHKKVIEKDRGTILDEAWDNFEKDADEGAPDPGDRTRGPPPRALGRRSTRQHSSPRPPTRLAVPAVRVGSAQPASFEGGVQ